jgi:hypothetical protein
MMQESMPPRALVLNHPVGSMPFARYVGAVTVEASRAAKAVRGCLIWGGWRMYEARSPVPLCRMREKVAPKVHQATDLVLRLSYGDEV